MNQLTGFFSAWIVCGLVLGLHVALPARRVVGYARDDGTGERLVYRLNGLAVFGVCVGLWFLAARLGIVPAGWLYTHRWEGTLGAVVLGLVFTAAIVLPAPSTGKSLLEDLYLGRLWNPRSARGHLDVKMFLYLVGAVLLELNLLSFAAHHFTSFADPSPGVALHVALFTCFVVDYLVFEHVHLYTYDLFAERVGFKLGWGCLAFYPYFYTVGLWFAAGQPDPGVGAPWLLVSAAVFLVGWILSRGANLQKYRFKIDPTRSFLGIRPRTVSDGERALLCSGFWALSRHVNYLGEILMATGLALSLGMPSAIWPWLYPLYYVALLVPRERDDDRRCAEKYGVLWDRYRERVPRRIVPGLY